MKAKGRATNYAARLIRLWDYVDYVDENSARFSWIVHRAGEIHWYPPCNPIHYGD